jgi:hypothetical protein
MPLSAHRRLSTADDVNDLWDASDGLVRGYWIVTALVTATAISLLVGGDERIVSAAFAGIRATGGAALWGCVYLALALALGITRAVSVIALRWSLWIAAVLFLLWGVSFADSVAASPSSSWLGVVNYVAIAAWCMSQAESYRRRSP